VKLGCFRLTPRPAPLTPPALPGLCFFLGLGLGFGLGFGLGVVVVERVLVDVDDDVEVG
jgi:hypothetical protein